MVRSKMTGIENAGQKAMKLIDETTDKAKETRRISREGKQVGHRTAKLACWTL